MRVDLEIVMSLIIKLYYEGNLERKHKFWAGKHPNKTLQRYKSAQHIPGYDSPER